MKIFKETLALTMANVISKILSIIFYIILARVLLPSEYGIFRYLMSFILIVLIPLSGVPVALTKYLSQHRDNMKIKNSIFTNCFLIFNLLFFVAMLVVAIISNNKLYSIIILLSLGIKIFYLGLIKGTYEFKKMSLLEPIYNLINLTLVVVVYMFFEMNLSIFIYFFAFSTVLVIVIFELFSRTHLRLKIEFVSKEKIKEIVKYAFPVMLGSASYELMQNIDTIFLKHMIGDYSVGIYSVSRTLIQAFFFIPQAVSSILLPKATYIFHNDKKSIPKLIKNLNIALFGTFIVGVLISVIYVFFGELIIELLFTNSYLAAYVPLLIISFGASFFIMFLILSSYWRSIDLYMLSLKIIGFGTFLNIILNYFLIPVYGVMGAAIATTASYIIIGLVSICFFQKNKLRG